MNLYIYENMNNTAILTHQSKTLKVESLCNSQWCLMVFILLKNIELI
jgi:hypothetical protein